MGVLTRQIRKAGYTLAVVVVAAAGAPAAPPATAAQAPDCFEQLRFGSDPVITCSFPTRLTDLEREGLKRVTQGALQDASCLVAISIERRRVTEAMAATDHVFEAPPQPVSCEVRTEAQVLPITATFAPRITIRGGLAVSATPGMANVTGVPRLLSWPVVQYVNRSGTIREGMLKVINAYLTFAVPGRGR